MAGDNSISNNIWTGIKWFVGLTLTAIGAGAVSGLMGIDIGGKKEAVEKQPKEKNKTKFVSLSDLVDSYVYSTVGRDILTEKETGESKHWKPAKFRDLLRNPWRKEESQVANLGDETGAGSQRAP